ncbi:DUF3298 and DUF4163 domain-containing protein [Oribacterium sp. FC2011]|uniref:DUF3298 and DUF4163 domain-containing protein n=1 Tax=Oribacterium sp. FC2011 TaxID=1408311 RepID=UPI0004E1595D|nr:DUF3298 and DUF4163 domain-containing protein [Oribacterium sp. FC2011]
MKRNIRKMSALVISAALLMSGCGGTTTTNSSTEAPAATAAETTASAETKEAETLATTEAAKETNAEAAEESGEVQLINAGIETNYESIYSDTDRKYLGGGYYPEITLGSYVNGEYVEGNENHPELVKAIDTYNKNTAECFKSDMDSAKELADEDPRFKEEDNEGYSYSVDMDASIERSDSNIFSVSASNYSFLGGAHGNTVITGFNVDPKTGEVLKISDVVTDKDAFIDAVDKQLHEEYPDIEEGLVVEDLKTAISDLYDGKDDMNLQFYMTHDALVTVFSAYDITAYAYGPEFVSLYYTDSADFLNEKYLKTTKDYAAEIGLDAPFSFETGDGTKKSITVNYLEPIGDDEYASEYTLRMSLDGKEYTEKLESIYGMRAYILVKDDNAYIYLDMSSDNDWHITQIYDINGSEIKKVGDFTEEAFYDVKPIDPSDFIMSSRGGLLSTYGIFRHYEMDTDGKPVPLTDAWWINNDFELTLNKPLKLSVMDELTEDCSDNGTETEIPEKTKLTLVRTDELNWVDARTPDGKIARIYVDTSDWPRKVDGIEIEEAFSGIVFAG